jgi:preprotein translocase subunit YajC
MDNPALPKGQRITSPGGPGEVIEVIGDKVVIKLDSGETNTFSSDEVVDDSSAG